MAKSEGWVVDRRADCHQIAAMMSDPGNVLFTLIPHCNPRGSVGFTMKSTRICLVSFACVAGAFSFGVIANAAIDLVAPSPKDAVVSEAPPSAPVNAAEAPAAPAFALASATSTPAELGPVKIKTVSIIVRDGEFAEQANEPAVAVQVPVQVPVQSPVQMSVQVPLPRPRPVGAPSLDGTASLAGQPGSLAITAATRRVNAEDGEMLSAAGIDRMKSALALTAEQEEYWPAIASELRALGKMLKGKGQYAHVDNDTMQRLYWAAAPLITRLSYEQKLKVKQMARLMGLTQVAEAL
jgi:hypothetical protein